MAARTWTGIELCSGVGMLGLGVSLAVEHIFGGCSRTVCHVERDAYAAACLVARMEEASLEAAPIWDDLATFDGRAWRGRVDWIAAGFPCQPWSAAGKREGANDERWLWPAIVRVIRDTQPGLVFLENVPGLISGGGLHHVLDDLAEMGFDAEWGCISAASVGASHRRERVFIVADTERPDARPGVKQVPPTGQRRHRPAIGGAIVADTGSPRLEKRPGVKRNTGPELSAIERGCGIFAPGPGDLDGWSRVVEDGSLDYRAPAVKPGVRVLADGLALVVDSSRADQLRCSGNGVVPLQAAAAIAELLRRLGKSR